MIEPAAKIHVIRVGWLAFEGAGRPWEGWASPDGSHWLCCGRALTRHGAARKARSVAAEVERRLASTIVEALVTTPTEEAPR